MAVLDSLFHAEKIAPKTLVKLVNQAINGDDGALNVFLYRAEQKTLTEEMADAMFAYIFNVTEGEIFQYLKSKGFSGWDPKQEARISCLRDLVFDILVTKDDLHDKEWKNKAVVAYLANKAIQCGSPEWMNFFSDGVFLKDMSPEMATVVLTQAHEAAVEETHAIVKKQGKTELDYHKKSRIAFLKGLAYEALYRHDVPHIVSGNRASPSDSLSVVMKGFEGPLSNYHFGAALKMFREAWGLPLAMQHFLHLTSDFAMTATAVERVIAMDPLGLIAYLMALDENREDPKLSIILAQSQFLQVSDAEKSICANHAQQLYQKRGHQKMQKYCLDVVDRLPGSIEVKATEVVRLPNSLEAESSDSDFSIEGHQHSSGTGSDLRTLPAEPEWFEQRRSLQEPRSATSYSAVTVMRDIKSMLLMRSTDSGYVPSLFC